VGKLNPNWNESSTDEELQGRFHKAMDMAGGEFVESVKYLATAWLPARDIVLAAMAERTKHYPTGEILVLPTYTVWKKHLLNAEEEQGVSPLIKYVLYADTSGAWRVQAVPVSSESFASRLALPAAWRGIRDEALSELTGVPDCIFIHAGGFIGPPFFSIRRQCLSLLCPLLFPTLSPPASIRRALPNCPSPLPPLISPLQAAPRASRAVCYWPPRRWSWLRRRSRRTRSKRPPLEPRHHYMYKKNIDKLIKACFDNLA
jgi:hypothetical protein